MTPFIDLTGSRHCTCAYITVDGVRRRGGKNFCRFFFVRFTLQHKIVFKNLRLMFFYQTQNNDAHTKRPKTKRPKTKRP